MNVQRVGKANAKTKQKREKAEAVAIVVEEKEGTDKTGRCSYMLIDAITS